MAVQDSTFKTAHVLDNEIVKASDFEFAFEQLVENVSKATQMFLESNQDFVINGKVLPDSGMNLKVSPIYGVCKSTGIPFGRTETTDETIGFAGSSTGRIDILEVQGDWQTYDNQQRAFNDPDTDTQTYQYVDTKKLMKPVYRIKEGVDGSGIAPELDAGWVKLAEISIRAGATSILESDIHNITADIAGLDNDDWTTEKDATYNIGYISDINERFREQHNEDGTHKDNVINSDSLDIGIGAKQINANILPIGGAVTIPNETISTTDSILSVITKAVNVITTLYNNYLKFGTYGFEGEVQISASDTSNVLDKPLKLSADGLGNATVKVGNTTVLTIDTNGKLHANYNTLLSGDNGYTLVVKAVTDSIQSALDALTTRVTNIENTSDVTVYANATLSSGTDGRYNVDNTVIYAATTENITLSGTQTIDGITPTDGVLILVKAQTDAKENGIYQYSSSSTWSRSNDFLSPNDLKSKLFEVVNGTQNGGKMFYLPKVNFTDGSDFGTDDISIIEYFGSIKPKANKIPMRDSSGHVKTATPTSADDAVNKGALLNLIYPIGSLYWTSKAPTDNGDPNNLFGGTWVQIKDRFVLASGDTYSNGATGGAATVTLTTNEMPSHNHSGTANSGGVSHTHQMDHTHNIEHTHVYTYTSANINQLGALVSTMAAGGLYLYNGEKNTDVGNSSISFASEPKRRDNYQTVTDTGVPSAYLHTHELDVNPTGGDQPHNNMPPYICKFCWERVS